jgi:hypothetical protein
MPTSTQLTIYTKFYLIDTWRELVSLALNLGGKHTKILPGKAVHLNFLRHIPADNEIEGLYEIYSNWPVAASAPSDSSTGSLFGDETSDSSTGSRL